MEEFSKLMANSLSPDNNIRGQAGSRLQNIVMDLSIMEVFFKYIADPQINLALRQAAAVYLMRYIKDYWFDDSDNALLFPHKVLSAEVKALFQQNIFTLMFAMQNEKKLMPVLKDTIIKLCEVGGGYLDTWPELMTILASALSDRNMQISVDIYDLIQKVIKRYRIEFKCDHLFREILNTLKLIASVLTQDGISCCQALTTDIKNNRNAALLYLGSLQKILSIFISLNFQDFPEFFEDNLQSWVEILKCAIEFELPIRQEDAEVDRLFLRVKKTAMRALNLYCSNYYEDFVEYHNLFFASVWGLLNSFKHEQKYEKLIKELLDYYKLLFQYNRAVGFDASTVQHMINHLIIPEMKLTAKELDEFEDNPINFLKVELEEIDMDSNKYHAINLLKNLLKNYPKLKEEYIVPLINNFIANYYQNPTKNWMDKIVAVNCIFATMIKTFAQRIGATEVLASGGELTSLINSIFTKEFQEVSNANLIARIYSLKFLSTFRLQIPTDWLNSVINMLVSILKSSDNITQTASLLTLEKILFMRTIHSNTSIVKDAVNTQETFVELITSLVNLASNGINIFALKCLFRTVFLTSEWYYQHVIETLSNSINNILKSVIANPSEDQFNYFLFETIAMVLRKLHATDSAMLLFFWNSIKGNLVFIMENFITDLVGYVIQILALNLELTDGEVSDSLHKNLLNSILHEPNNWELPMKYMFNPFSAYLKTSFTKFNSLYLSGNRHLDAAFKILLKLLEMKSYTTAFEILDRVINSFSLEIVFGNLKTMFYNFLVIFESLKSSNKKAHKEFSKVLLAFLAKLIIKSNSKYLIDLMESASSGITVPLLNDLLEYIEELDFINKRLVTFAYCSLIRDYCQAFGLDTLKVFTVKLIENLQKFNRYNLNSTSLDKLTDGQDLSYAANNYNKILNAEVKTENEDYKKIAGLNEMELFFDTVEKVKGAIGVDLVAEVFNILKEKEKQFIQSKKNSK